MTNVDFYWKPASNGTEKPFTKNGVRYQYMYNTVTQQHAYLNLDTDMFLTHAEAFREIAS